MKTWQLILLIATALMLVAVTILTWGSIGSVTTGFCLVMMGAALLLQKFLTNRDADDFDMEQ